MKGKRFLSVILLSLMVISLVACNANSDTADNKQNKPALQNEGTDTSERKEAPPTNTGGLVPMADADNPITFNIFSRDPNTAPAKDNPVNKKITELTGVTIEYEFLVGDLAQKMGVMLAGGDYPDAIFAEAPKFIDAGAFIPLEDMLPSYKNLYEHYAPCEESLTMEDGHIYILEINDVRKNPAPIFENQASGLYIQKAVLEEFDYPIPRTIDEYFKLIEDYQAKYPEIDGVKTIGFEVLCDGWRSFCLKNPPLHLLGGGNDGDAFVDLDTMEASLYQITDTAKNYYKKLNEMYHKGVIDPETLTQSFDQYISRISTGAVLGFCDQRWNFGPGEDVLKNDGKYERTYVSVPIANPGVKDSYLDGYSTDVVTGINGVGITVDCKDPERLLAFYDWLLQKEVQDYLQWGEEDTDFTVLENGGKILTEERRMINRDVATQRDLTGQTLWYYSPKRQGFYDDGSPCGPVDSEDEFLASLSDYDQNFLAAYGYKYPAQMLSEPVVRPKYYPIWAMAIEDGSPANVANSKINNITEKNFPRLILAERNEFDEMWEGFLKEMEDANVQPYLDEINRQIQATLE